MIKRVTLCSIAFILTYCIIYAVSYNGKREEIEQKINGLFAANAHSFADSILVREGMYFFKKSDTFEMLINADDYIATKKEICQRLWTLNEKDVNNRYNALAWRLRESLAQINGIELLTIKDTALQLVFTKKKGKKQAG